MQPKMIAVVLSGCGHQDGAEIHETTLTLWAIHKHGAEFQCFAPNTMQQHVLNHITGQEMDEQRNVMVEAARIARGKIKDIKEFNQNEFDGIVFPGGLGAAKNLCTYALEGPDCTVNPDVDRAVRDMHAASKPIGALCIAPVIIAKVLGSIELTIGQDDNTARNLELMGATHSVSGHGEIVVDRDNKVVTTPCYMLQSRVDQIAEGAENLVKAVLDLTD